MPSQQGSSTPANTERDMRWAMDPVNRMASTKHEALYESINRMLLHHLTPTSADEANTVAGMFSELIELTGDPIAKIIFANYITNHLVRGSPAPFDFFTQRFAIAEYTTLNARHISPPLAHIKFNIYDLLLKDAGAPLHRLPDTPIYKSYDTLGKYSVILTDRTGSIEWRKQFDALHSARIIGHSHSNWDYMFMPCNEHLYIVPYENYLMRPFLLRRSSIPSHIFEKLMQSHEKKCEYVYTGSYQRLNVCKGHNGDSIWRKQKRMELEEMLQRKLRPNAPLIFCVSGNTLDINETAAGLNGLSKKCDVVYRPHWRQYDTMKKMLNDAIILDLAWGKSTDLQYEAADIVLSDFSKGAFLSCLMSGFPAVPISSKTVNGKSFDDFCKPIMSGKEDRPVIKRLLKIWPKIPQIGDVETLLDIINSSDYVKWYEDNLEYLQRAMFGHFLQEGAAAKTAEYIVRFISEGTMGDQCHALHFYN